MLEKKSVKDHFSVFSKGGARKGIIRFQEFKNPATGIFSGNILWKQSKRGFSKSSLLFSLYKLTNLLIICFVNDLVMVCKRKKSI
ncbi:hypothetical protein CLV31_105159 [Algoriphagus aquaeductus]|uniref:Uncharacterized protein n=1 Tax=Algoriphagus aquaeductus TaxID=475299 RepID=A0A326RRA6_9BACT|nr:hypothetical protein CLV31_105159 [Algoriphagus aquaeductus]